MPAAIRLACLLALSVLTVALAAEAGGANPAPAPAAEATSELTPKEWDKLKGLVIEVSVNRPTTPTGITLGKGDKVKVVPHPTDTWKISLYTDNMTTNYLGVKQKSYTIQTGDTEGHGGHEAVDNGDPTYLLGELVVTLVNGKTRTRFHAGVIENEGEMLLGPNLNSGSGTKGMIRVKLVSMDEPKPKKK
jgi:hypothetical protein